jgi:protoporphyrin/coproporphyrin ferrochelatase
MQMIKDGIDEAVGIVMAPHFSSMSVAKYIECVEKAQEEFNGKIKFSYVKSYHDNKFYLEALSTKLGDAFLKFSDQEKENLHVIFTAHSLPERILKENDPYLSQLLETSELLAEKNEIKNWSFSFQSAGKTEEKWLGPDLLEEIEKLRNQGVKSILVCSVGFIIDHLEVMYDIDVEAKELAERSGIHLERAGSLNDHPLLIKAFAELTKEKFSVKSASE